MSINTHEKIEELAREVRIRRRVYPRLVARGELQEEESARRIRVLEAVIADYMQEFKQEEAAVS